MIRCWVGRGGAGKSYAATRYLRMRYNQGRAIYSNTPLIDLRVKWRPDLGLFGMWVPVNAETFGIDWADGYIYTLQEILTLDNCDVFLDEFASWLSSRDSKDVPPEFSRFLAQDRREGVDLVATHRTFNGLVKEVRDNTAEVSKCYRFGPLSVQRVYDPDEPTDVVYRWLGINSSIYDLYQTHARVGDRFGNNYGLGKRKGYVSAAGGRSLIRLDEYGPHKISIYVRPEQLTCLRRKFGDEHVGFYRQEVEVGEKYKTKVARYVSAFNACNYYHHVTYDLLSRKRGIAGVGAEGSTNFAMQHKAVNASLYR